MIIVINFYLILNLNYIKLINYLRVMRIRPSQYSIWVLSLVNYQFLIPIKHYHEVIMVVLLQNSNVILHRFDLHSKDL